MPTLHCCCRHPLWHLRPVAFSCGYWPAGSPQAIGNGASSMGMQAGLPGQGGGISQWFAGFPCFGDGEVPDGGLPASGLCTGQRPMSVAAMTALCSAKLQGCSVCDYHMPWYVCADFPSCRQLPSHR
jgi:hypothetical protein